MRKKIAITSCVIRSETQIVWMDNIYREAFTIRLKPGKKPMQFRTSRAKVARAQKALKELSFILENPENSPFQFVWVPSVDLGRSLVRLEFLDAPDEAFAIVAEIANNLRSALEISVADLARKNGSEPDRHTSFPNSRNPALWKDNCEQRLKLLKPKARIFIENLNVHPNGDRQLFGLTQLDNFGKHTNAIVVSGDLQMNNLMGWNHKHPSALDAGEVAGLLAAQNLRENRPFQNGNIYDLSRANLPLRTLMEILSGGITLGATYCFAIESDFPNQQVVPTLENLVHRVIEVLDAMDREL